MADFNIAAFLAPSVSIVAMCVSAYFARTAINVNRKDRESKNHMEQAVLALEHAYEALTNDGRSITPVESNRLNWLTAARHIESYKVLKQGVTERSHKAMIEDTEEYWRHRFYVALDMYRIHDVGYYAEKQVPKASELDVGSLIVVYGFASWPDDKDDILNKADFAGIVNSHDIRQGNIGLTRYLEQSKKFAPIFQAIDERRRAELEAARTERDQAAASSTASGSS